MPSCRPEVIPTIVNLILKWKCKSVLEVGPGFGKWGVLLREYMEIWNNGVFHKDEWKGKIDCVEIFEEYCNPIWDCVYDTVYIGSVMDYLNILKNYDLILMVDVIEHLSKDEGIILLNNIKGKYIVSTPNYDSPQGESFDNVYETHKSRWHKRDFPNATVVAGRYIVGWRDGKVKNGGI